MSDDPRYSIQDLADLADVSRRADNPALLGELADLGVDVATILGDIDRDRAGR